MRNKQILRYSTGLIILCFALTSCSPKSFTHTKKPGKKIVVSDSQKYGIWVDKSESDPRYTKKRLEKNRFYHIISDPGGSQLSQSIVVMHWIEREPMPKETIDLLVTNTDYNSHIVYGNYVPSRIEPFGQGHWSDVERINDVSEIINKETWTVGNLNVDLYLSSDRYLVKKSNYILPDTYFNKTVIRYFSHAFINNDSLSIEIFLPVTGGLESIEHDIKDPQLYSQKCIEHFILNFLEIL